MIARITMALLTLVAATAASEPSYNPRETFAPFDMEQAVNRYRGGNGLPGPDYWQNHADYAIRATLDPAAKTITGSVEIRYANNSPDALDVLWLQLDQNLYRVASRGGIAAGGVPRGSTEGMMLDGVWVDAGGRQVELAPLVTDARAQLRLPQPLPAGGKATIRIRYHYVVPAEAFGGRTGWLTGKSGDIFSVAQWYPHMAVYDDLRGWDTLPYLAQEFYLEYGNFDYWLTVPSDMLVAGSGELMNPGEVLIPAQQAALARARTSDTTVTIRAPGAVNDPATRPHSARALTWHFRMENTRDVAWSASAAFALGCGTHQFAGRPHGAGPVLLSTREPGAGAVGAVHGISEGRGGAVLGQMVSLSLAQRDQRRGAGGGNGISRHRVRRYRRRGEAAVLDHRARDRA